MAKLNEEKAALGALAVDEAKSTKPKPGSAAVEYQEVADVAEDSSPTASAKTPLPQNRADQAYREKAEKQVASRISKLQKQ